MIKTTTLRMNKELHKEVMKHCIDLDISFNEYVNYLIKKDMDNFRKKSEEQDKKELDIVIEKFLKQFD